MHNCQILTKFIAQVHVLLPVLLSHKEVDEQEQGQSSKIYFVQYFHFCTRFCRP